jgi:hypothetical protein
VGQLSIAGLYLLAHFKLLWFKPSSDEKNYENETVKLIGSQKQHKQLTGIGLRKLQSAVIIVSTITLIVCSLLLAIPTQSPDIIVCCKDLAIPWIPF